MSTHDRNLPILNALHRLPGHLKVQFSDNSSLLGFLIRIRVRIVLCVNKHPTLLAVTTSINPELYISWHSVSFGSGPEHFQSLAHVGSQEAVQSSGEVANVI